MRRKYVLVFNVERVPSKEELLQNMEYAALALETVYIDETRSATQITTLSVLFGPKKYLMESLLRIMARANFITTPKIAPNSLNEAVLPFVGPFAPYSAAVVRYALVVNSAAADIVCKDLVR